MWSRVLVAACSLCMTSSRLAVGIPVFYGTHEVVNRVGELPQQTAAQLSEELEENVSIGFAYQQFHLYSIPMWSWNGRHVLLGSRRYWELSDLEWQGLLNEKPSEKFAKPLSYSLPPGWILVVGLMISAIVVHRLFRDRAAALLRQPSYRAATQLLFEADRENPSQIHYRGSDLSRFRKAVESLTSQGIPPSTARENLAIIAKSIAQQRDDAVHQQMELAAQIDRQGDWRRSIQLYDQVIKSLEPGDARIREAEDCIQAIRNKQK